MTVSGDLFQKARVSEVTNNFMERLIKFCTGVNYTFDWSVVSERRHPIQLRQHILITTMTTTTAAAVTATTTTTTTTQ